MNPTPTFQIILPSAFEKAKLGIDYYFDCFSYFLIHIKNSTKIVENPAFEVRNLQEYYH